MGKVRESFAIGIVCLLTLGLIGCVPGKKSTPAKPSVQQAIENVKDADDHLAEAESHLRSDPPAVPEAKKEIGDARTQLGYASGDLKQAVKSTSENDKKAAKFDEMQDDYLGPASMRLIGWIVGLWLFAGILAVVLGALNPLGWGGIVSKAIIRFIPAANLFSFARDTWLKRRGEAPSVVVNVEASK